MSSSKCGTHRHQEIKLGDSHEKFMSDHSTIQADASSFQVFNDMEMMSLGCGLLLRRHFLDGSLLAPLIFGIFIVFYGSMLAIHHSTSTTLALIMLY